MPNIRRAARLSLLVLLFLPFTFAPGAAASALGARIYGNRHYSDETVAQQAGLGFSPRPKIREIRERLEATGYYSSVRVEEENGVLQILVREKRPDFLLPFFARSGEHASYGLAGGALGLGGSSAMLLGRAQFGTGSRAASLYYRDEHFGDSLWITSATAEYESALHDVYEGRKVARRFRDEMAGLTLLGGRHLGPSLALQADVHLERHRFERLEGGVEQGTMVSHRLSALWGRLYGRDGLESGYLLKPYVEVTAPWSSFSFVQAGLSGQASLFRRGDLAWITRSRAEIGRDLPLFQQFELGGPSLRGYPAQSFRANGYAASANDLFLTSWALGSSLQLRPLLFLDYAYVQRAGRVGTGGGLQLYFRNVAVPAVQFYAGYGFHPKGFAISAAIGPQI